MRSLKINNEVLGSYFRCPLKAHFKLQGKRGEVCDFETLDGEVKASALARLEEQAVRAPSGLKISTAALAAGTEMIIRPVLETDTLSIRFDALKRVKGASRLGDFHYVPLAVAGLPDQSERQRHLLQAQSLMLGEIQGFAPAHGLLSTGDSSRKLSLSRDLDTVRTRMQALEDLRRTGTAPRLRLNRHCALCEFRSTCLDQARSENNLSLLGGIGKELDRYARRGITSIAQLAATYRPRRKPKRSSVAVAHRSFPLHALALQANQIYVVGSPEIPAPPVSVYLDLEGDASGRCVYVIGVLIVGPVGEHRHSLWADEREEESRIFRQFMEILASIDNYRVFHYGGYETAFLKRMRSSFRPKRSVDKVLANCFNVLSLLHNQVYFPTRTNALKEVASYLGCRWSDPHASGSQSVVWRMRWEASRDEELKQKLLTYNMEDCEALRKLTGHLRQIDHQPSSSPDPAAMPTVRRVEDLPQVSSRREWRKAVFATEQFEQINRFAQFDYQREKVFVRTSPAIRRACRKSASKRIGRLRPNRKIEIRANVCPHCQSTRLSRNPDKVHVRLAYDLKINGSGVTRQIIHCTAMLHACLGCKKTFLPQRYKRRDKHFHGLKSWAIYQHVVHRTSFGMLSEMFHEHFGPLIHVHEFFDIQVLMAHLYRPTYKLIVDRLVARSLIQADETEINLKKGSGYVWVLANAEDVAYVFRPTREVGFLRESLGNFTGVLVSDFYVGYESLGCLQQKCLIHLMRDLNEDLLRNPFDADLKTVTGLFGELLRSIVQTIDRHGLKRHFLRGHLRDVEVFFKAMEKAPFMSPVAEGYRGRLLRQKDRLFQFLEHDGVPWNNNGAEHAVKKFAKYRVIADGMLSARGLEDYLVLLSVCETCRRRGISFLRFMLSRQRDVAGFTDRGGQRYRQPPLDIYPAGFPVHQVQMGRMRAPRRLEIFREPTAGVESLGAETGARKTGESRF